MRPAGGHHLEEAAGDDGDAVVEAGAVERAELAAVGKAGIGDQHVETAECREGPLDQQAAGFGNREVAQHDRGLGAGLAQLLGHGLAAGSVVQGMQQYPHAGPARRRAMAAPMPLPEPVTGWSAGVSSW